MGELSNKYKGDAEYPEEKKTLIKNLAKMNYQKNVIQYTFTNIIYIDERIN